MLPCRKIFQRLELAVFTEETIVVCLGNNFSYVKGLQPHLAILERK